MLKFVYALAAIALIGACSQSAQKSRPPSVVLITFDTTRADVLGCYGGKADTSPNIDEFAKQAIRFERAWTVAPLTLPAHASMLTGLVPSRHGVRDNGRNPLPEQALSVAEIAQDHGIQTGATLSSAVLNQGFGTAQGFDYFSAPGDTGNEVQNTHFPSWAAGQTLQHTEKFLSNLDDDGGMFLWVHIWEPHAPYQPSAKFKRSNPYLGDVAEADDAFGKLISQLKEHNRFEDSTIIFTSDHGEAFGEHGEYTHGAMCFNSTMQVPLIIKTPDSISSVDSRIASVADIAPTIAAALALEPLSNIDGHSLLLPDAQNGAYLETLQGWYAYGWSPIRGWVNEKGKYLRGGVERHLSLSDQPNAKSDSGWKKIIELDKRPRLNSSGVVDGALAEQVEALGYAVVAGEAQEVSFEPGQYLDPADCSAEYKQINRLQNLANQSKFQEAIQLGREIIAKNPHNIWAYDMLGACLVSAKQHQAAIGPLQKVVMLKRASARTYGNLAVALLVSGRETEARPVVQKWLEMNPENKNAQQIAAQLKLR